MRRKSERRKSTEVSSPAPSMHSTRRSTRRRTSTSSSVEPTPGNKENQIEEQLQDKVSSKEIDREIEEDNKKDPRDSSSERSEKEDIGNLGNKTNKKESSRTSRRKQIQTIVEENGSHDEEVEETKIENEIFEKKVKENELESIEEIKEKEQTPVPEMVEENNSENVHKDLQTEKEYVSESKEENKHDEKEEGEMNTDSEDDSGKSLKEKSLVGNKEENVENQDKKEEEKNKKVQTEVCIPKAKPPRRRRFDERPEDVEKNKRLEEERLQENKKNSNLNHEIETKESEHDIQSVTNTPSTRKRRWLSQKSSESKPKVLAITTDSLKDIISDVPLPVPLSDVRLESSPEPEEIPILEEKINVDFDEEDLEERENKLEKSKEKEIKKRDRENNVREKKSKEKETRPEKELRREKHSEETQILSNRKISIINEEEKQAMALARPPSPPKNASSTILYITNLVRPFTVLQLKGLLARTGKIVENGFWIDKIKSKCYVQYETEDQAIETRHALHGVRWPPSNPKCLNVDFGSSTAMQKAIASTAEEIIKINSDSLKENRTIIGTGWEKERFENEERKNVQVSRPIREWDVGKKEELERDGRRNRERDRSVERQRNDRDRDRDRERVERDRERERDRGDRNIEKDRRRYSLEREYRDRRRSESGSPIRKFKRKENDPPIRLLDDLFRKTKTTPCIYWLPLTPEQIAEKEEIRRKRLEENEIMRKEREKERERREKERERDRERERERRREREKSGERDRRRSRSRDRRRY